MFSKNCLARIRQRFVPARRKTEQKPLCALMADIRAIRDTQLANALRAAELALAYSNPDVVIVEKPCPECRARAEQQLIWRMELITELAMLSRKSAESGETVPVDSD